MKNWGDECRNIQDWLKKGDSMAGVQEEKASPVACSQSLIDFIRWRVYFIYDLVQWQWESSWHRIYQFPTLFFSHTPTPGWTRVVKKEKKKGENL